MMVFGLFMKLVFVIIWSSRWLGVISLWIWFCWGIIILLILLFKCRLIRFLVFVVVCGVK